MRRCRWRRSGCHQRQGKIYVRERQTNGRITQFRTFISIHNSIAIQVSYTHGQGLAVSICPADITATVKIGPIRSIHPGKGIDITCAHCQQVNLGIHRIQHTGSSIVEPHRLGFLDKGKTARDIEKAVQVNGNTACCFKEVSCRTGKVKGYDIGLSTTGLHIQRCCDIINHCRVGD